jgi:hypothetical protein
MKVRVPFIFAILMFASVAAAQLDTGNAYVTVTNCSGADQPGVTLTLSGNGVAPQVQVTNALGQGRFLALAPGDYSLKAQLEGFAPSDTPVTITKGKNTEVPVQLQPAVCDDNPSDVSCCSQSEKAKPKKEGETKKEG